MKVVEPLYILFRRWRSEYRYHTVASQTLALLQQVAICAFLFTGWQDNVFVLIAWAIVSIGFCMFIQSRLVTERPSKRGLRRFIRELEVLMSIVTAVIIVVFSGSATTLAVSFLVYVIGSSITLERHGRSWFQID